MEKKTNYSQNIKRSNRYWEKVNKQLSARLTRWLDRLIHSEIVVKHAAISEMKLTDFIIRKQIGNSRKNFYTETAG